MSTIALSANDSYAVAVGATALVLVEGFATNQSGGSNPQGDSTNPRQVTVHNNHASQILYVGWGSDLDTSNGLVIPAGGYKVFLMYMYDEMWAIASGSATDTRVSVLHGKGDPA
ncbi:MAG: hypothetical protein V3U14_12780 [candidate division NC10 bacterium]